ncbi:hypothetical protein KUF71_002902 [Frankliniella fusca]|uniref:ATP-dependent DNA helicase n=1 Tax=Frankliniella fusca TaxID=407009 RepID=A0AAE1GPK5_9NEOP|nr:hypothetical protein KUF71_002902 [Frankliniella fusca]
MSSGDLKRKIIIKSSDDDESKKNCIREEGEIVRKKFRKKKCCVKGCTKTKVDTKLHTFPSIWKSCGKEALEDDEKIKSMKALHQLRCVLYSGKRNEDASEKDELCSIETMSRKETNNHRVQNEHNNNCNETKSDNVRALDQSEAGGSFTIMNSSSESTKVKDCKNKNDKVFNGHNYCKGTGMGDDEMEKEIDTVLQGHDVLVEKTIQNENVAGKNRRQCCMKECSNTSCDHSMFGFPKVLSVKFGHVETPNLQRFRDWVLACGKISPTPKKNRLKHNAVPSENICPIISDAFIQDYDLNLRKWKESLDSQVTKESCALAFEEDMGSLTWRHCTHCNERIMVSSLKKNEKCQHKSHCWKYSVLNDMDPGEVPEELKELTFIEEQVIAKVHPMITVFKIKGHQFAYKGNAISFSQDIQEIATQLPHKVKDLNSVICIKKGRVRRALEWLKKNNPLYKDIVISEENLQMLPENGYVSDDVPCVSIPSEEDNVNVTDIGQEEEDGEENVQQSGVPHKISPHQDEAIKNCLKWPSMSEEPINEKNMPGFLPSAFPILYPYGVADLNDSRPQKINTADYFRHLMNYFDCHFAKHPKYRFLAYNVWQRWTALTDGSVFVKNNKEFQNMTISQLKDLVSENQNIMKQIMYQASNLKGSKAYWNARANELKDMVEQLGLPTIFLTLSCADGHWRDLYKLLTDLDIDSLSAAQRRKLVQDNPLIVDSFFDYRVKSLIKNVLETHYEVTDYWYRIEYQHRGDLEAKKAIHKILMKSCAERDIGPQEVCHSLFRLSLHSAGGRKFITVNLSEKKKWIQLHDHEEEKHGKSTVEKYKDRADKFENMSLWNFAKNLDMSKFHENKKENIVRVFPRLKMNLEDNDAHEDYCKQQILLHLPWRDECSLKKEDETWEEVFTRNGVNDIVKCVNKITDRAIHTNAKDEYESEENESDDEESTNVLGELLSSRLGPKSSVPTIKLGNRQVDTEYSWKNLFEKYEQYGSIIDFENFIEKMKKCQPETQQEPTHFPNVQLSPDQNEIVNIVKEEIMKIKSCQLITDANVESIKRIIVQGKAGTGKSLIIKYLTTLLTKELGSGSFLLATPTGVSAVLINGKTLHSIFKLPRKNATFTSLTGEQQNERCKVFNTG